MPPDDPTQSTLSPDESRLIERLQRGDGDAIAQLQNRYRDELRLFCQRMLGGDAAGAEDIVQDVLLTCCRIEPESRPQTSIRGWLYQIARRRCIDVRRRQKPPEPGEVRGLRRAQATYENAIDPLTTPAGKALKLDRAAKVLELLEDLDDDLRTVVIMRYFQDLPREDISEAIGLSIAGTKARLAKAMKILRDKMGALGDSGT